MAAGIWVRLVTKNHIDRDMTAECARDGWEEALTEACHTLDMPRPIVMPKHRRDFEQFSQTRFLKEHFVESVPFDRMEVEYIDPESRKKKKINEQYL